MRKITGIGLLLVMAFSLTACIVPDPADADADKVAAAKDALTIATETSADLVLPGELEGYDGVNITWASSNEAVISNAGAAVRQDEDTEVTLTATLTYGNASDSKEFSVTVKRKIRLTYYTLFEGYENGWLTVEDIKSIAYYRNDGTTDNEEIMGEDYVPIPKNPEVLSAETEMAIKEKLAANARLETRPDGTPMYPGIKADTFRIEQYYGIYNDCIVVETTELIIEFDDSWMATIGGVNILYGRGNGIYIWKQS